MPTAWLNLRHGVPERWAAFEAGLRRAGFVVERGVTSRPRPRDILVTWNRIREGGAAALAFERYGNTVLVAENAAWGNSFAGGHWYTIARGQHNTAGRFPVGGPERWDGLAVELQPWRADGETIILPQRGIGQPPTAMPMDWPQQAARRFPGARVRPHPGRGDERPLEKDLARAAHVVTWGSGAAIRACMWGCRVTSQMPEWIGQQDNTDPGRLAMLRRLAWAQWQLTEIAHGRPFDHLLRF